MTYQKFEKLMSEIWNGAKNIVFAGIGEGIVKT